MRIGRQLSGALMAIHEAGVLHGDIKPANILLADRDLWGSWKLADFGVAHDGSRPKSRLGFTPRYAAPERLDGHFAPPADVFALGMTLLDASEGIKIPAEFRSTVLEMVRDEIEARPAAEQAYHAFVQAEARSIIQRFVADESGADSSLF